MSGARLAGGIIMPFTVVTLIWSSTWIVIRDQLGVVPPSWSICYRFALAAIGMAVLARMTGVSLRLGRREIAFAALLGLTLFTVNFNLLYRAEAHLTSGLCALVYALLLIPNSLFARAFFRERVTRDFLVGSSIAIVGIALLFVNEYRASLVAAPGEVLLGLGLCTAAVLCASVGNVMQAAPFARTIPMTSLLVWSMAIGAAGDAVFAWITTGPPVIDLRPAYGLGVLYLAIAGSVITFPLYFGLIQRIGAGPAAYTSVLIPIIAMGISTAFENYRWTPLASSGVVFALGGMVFALRARLRQTRRQASAKITI